ncbi:hypothetical protein [Erwinia sp. B116]|uniref:COG4648 family protein n=1 Tax=Erwinia sp. B116 TaxID=1561024 RepID=UPI000C768ABB|nr:hypothetical protein [Erwinia sp. B116]PLV62109.1 DNA gyrase subunit B [Erwinia sp. B116]
MPRLITLLSGLLLLLWPPLVWLSISHPPLRGLLLPLALLFVLRWLALRRRKGALASAGKWLAAAAALLCLVSSLLQNERLLLWYPVAVNAILLLLFAASLFSRMPLVERLARVREPDLPPYAVVYTRRVTQVWCGFFIFNGSVALFTCLADSVYWWTLWNGVISYLLIGLLMACEWCIRQRMRAAR